MKKFNFFKKNTFNYACAVLFSFLCLMFFGAIIIYVFTNSSPVLFYKLLNIVVTCLFLVFLFFSLKILVSTIIHYKATYQIGNGKLKFVGKCPTYSNVPANTIIKKSKKQVESVIDVSGINFIFITNKQATKVGTCVIEKEEINGIKQVMGQMYILREFVYNEERCCESFMFESLNKRKDYLSQFYETMCSMIFQEDALNELYKNGFCGDIFLSSTIYQPRKQVFDEMFEKYSVPVEKIHIF